eukprot:gene7875-5502_t
MKFLLTNYVALFVIAPRTVHYFHMGGSSSHPILLPSPAISYGMYDIQLGVEIAPPISPLAELCGLNIYIYIYIYIYFSSSVFSFSISLPSKDTGKLQPYRASFSLVLCLDGRFVLSACS